MKMSYNLRWCPETGAAYRLGGGETMYLILLLILPILIILSAAK